MIKGSRVVSFGERKNANEHKITKSRISCGGNSNHQTTTTVQGNWHPLFFSDSLISSAKICQTDLKKKQNFEGYKSVSFEAILHKNSLA